LVLGIVLVLGGVTLLAGALTATTSVEFASSEPTIEPGTPTATELPSGG
jgi:hypothetical protein